MPKGPVVFHRRLCVHIAIVVLIFACFPILGAGIFFNYMCHKIIPERSEKAFIFLQQQNLINYCLSHKNPAANPYSLKTIVKTRFVTAENKAIRKISKRKIIKTANELNAKFPPFETTTIFDKVIVVVKYFIVFLSNMSELQAFEYLFNNKADNTARQAGPKQTGKAKDATSSKSKAQMAAKKLNPPPPKLLFIPPQVKAQLASIQGLEILFWYKTEEHAGYLWRRNRGKTQKSDYNNFTNYKLPRKPGINLLLKSQNAFCWKYQVRRNFGQKDLFSLEFDMTSLFKKFIVSSLISSFILILIFSLVLWKIIYIQGNRLEDAISGLEDGMKEIFLGNYKHVLIEAREFVFTQRIANIMNQMIYFFNTQTEKSQKEFQRDPLMKIFTRRYLMDALEKETIRAQRYQRPLVFILVDIDHFKNFNDTYGHLMGDKVLQQTAKILKAETRETDIIARYGGEEIAIILSETELKDGTIVAEKLREAVEKNKFSFQKQTVHVTISLGVTILDNTEDTIMTLIHRADEALYTAKQNGRNQVCEKIT